MWTNCVLAGRVQFSTKLNTANRYRTKPDLRFDKLNIRTANVNEQKMFSKRRVVHHAVVGDRLGACTIKSEIYELKIA